MPFAVEEVGLGRRIGVVVFDCLRDNESVVFVEGNEVTIKGCVVGRGEAQAVFRIEAVRLVFRPCMRGVAREDRAKHVKRTDIGRDLNAPVRIRGEDVISERML